MRLADTVYMVRDWGPARIECREYKIPKTQALQEHYSVVIHDDASEVYVRVRIGMAELPFAYFRVREYEFFVEAPWFSQAITEVTGLLELARQASLLANLVP